MASYWERPYQETGDFFRIGERGGDDAPAPSPATARSPENAPRPATGVDWEDVGKGAAGGVARGTTGLAGLLGDARAAMNAGGEWIGNRLGLAPLPEDVKRANAAAAPPTSADIRGAVEPYTGAFYEPKTRAGKFASTIGEFAPAAAVPGAGMSRFYSSIPGLRVGVHSLPQVVAARTVNTVAPAVASETAGQITENTPYEPHARFIGGLGGGLAAAKAISPQTAMSELTPVSKGIFGAAASGAAHVMGGGPEMAALSFLAPYIANAAAQSRVGQQYLTNRALPQSARDVLTQTLVQQELSQPEGIERNKANRAEAARRYQRERRARGLE